MTIKNKPKQQQTKINKPPPTPPKNNPKQLNKQTPPKPKPVFPLRLTSWMNFNKGAYTVSE